ncbi:uncharacterized protein [Miscanthus floridulus]|uniref:uncharacterized protein n=1 Tax=Miscanthus floridulus TaxID=154761 RepID=UPI0034595285
MADDLPSVAQELEDRSLREVAVPLAGEGHLGLAPAAEGPACRCQRASVARGVRRWRTSAFAVLMRRPRWQRFGSRPPLWRARIKELEEELTRAVGEQDTFRSRAEQAEASAKAVTGQLGMKQGVHLLTKGALAEALKVAEASRVEALALKEKAKLEREASRAAEASRVEVQHWKEKAEASRVEAQHWEEKAEGLEKEVFWVAEASVAVQAVLEAEIEEHNALWSTARTVCEALEVEGV